MRSITLVQAFQYWLKLLRPADAALLPPRGARRTASADPDVGAVLVADWVEPLRGDHALYLTYSLSSPPSSARWGCPTSSCASTPTGTAAPPGERRWRCSSCSPASTCCPSLYGVIGRYVASDLVAAGRADSVVLELPSRLFDGAGRRGPHGAARRRRLRGVPVDVDRARGVGRRAWSSQDLVRWGAGHRQGIRTFRLATVVVVAVVAGAHGRVGRASPVAHAVELAFAVAASTFCPMLLLGIWWRGLTARGAIAGLVVGRRPGDGSRRATTFGIATGGWFGVVMTQPAAVSVPLSFATMVLVSLATRASAPEHVAQTMVRLHAPEHIDLNRGSFHPERWDRRPRRPRTRASDGDAAHGIRQHGRDRSSLPADRSSRLSPRTASGRRH